jgi:DNA-directed RNA polymerases I and III subunit RPAC1
VLVMQANTVTSAHAYMSQDVDNAWSFDHFARSFSVDFNSTTNDGNDIEFDVTGVDPAIMNAVRRILVSEVAMPTCTV